MSDDFINRFMRTSTFMERTHDYFSDDAFEKYLDDTYSSTKGGFLVFKYSAYYPLGGMEDLVIRTDQIESVLSDIRVVWSKYVGRYDTLNYFNINDSTIIDINREKADTE